MILTNPVYIYRNTWETSRNYYSRARDSQFYQIPYPPHIRDDIKPGEYYELLDEANNIYEHSFYKKHIKGTVIRYGIYQQVQIDGKTGQIFQVLGTGRYDKGILKSYVKNIQVASNLYNTLGMMPKELTLMISDYTQNDRLKNYHEIDLTEILKGGKFKAILTLIMNLMLDYSSQRTTIGSISGIVGNKRLFKDVSGWSDTSEGEPVETGIAAVLKMANIEYRLNKVAKLDGQDLGPEAAFLNDIMPTIMNAMIWENKLPIVFLNPYSIILDNKSGFNNDFRGSDNLEYSLEYKDKVTITGNFTLQQLINSPSYAGYRRRRLR